MSPLLASQLVTVLLFMKNRSQKMTSERRKDGQIANDERKVFGRDRAVSATEMYPGVPNSQGGR